MIKKDMIIINPDIYFLEIKKVSNRQKNNFQIK